jgi:hypothetical protein
MTDQAIAFFDTLLDRALVLIDSFPLTIEPPPMAQVVEVLEPAVLAARSRSLFENPDQAVRKAVAAALATAALRSAGLNTVGMLLDRLSILAVKHWNLLHRSQAPDKAQALRSGQIAEIIRALAEAAPGQSSVNNKMTTHAVEATASRFSDACYGLFTTNLLLWEAQEVLYNHDIKLLPSEELRKYIEFFSRGNLERNAYIQASDETWWRLMLSPTAG